MNSSSNNRRAGRLKPVSNKSSPTEAESGLKLDTIEGEQAAKQFSKLLDQGFGVKGPGCFLDDFPVWHEKLGPEGERVIRIGVWDHQTLVSCAAVRLAQLRVPGGSIEVALIGAVATHQDYRGKGLASRTVSLAVEWARERGAVLALLWGGETALYERLGFELCGVQVRPLLSDLDLGEPIKDFSAITLGRGWISTLMQCLRLRGSGLKLQPSDERWMEAHQGVDWYWLGDPESPQAYAAIGRGIDLHGLVHEWGGDSPNDLKTLLRLIQMERPEAQLLASPELLAAWGLSGPRPASEIEFLCMARALDVAKIAKGFGLPLSDSSPLVTTPNAAVCRMLFGPPSEIGDQAVAGAFPLWIWGLDAV